MVCPAHRCREHARRCGPGGRPTTAHHITKGVFSRRGSFKIALTPKRCSVSPSVAVAGAVHFGPSCEGAQGPVRAPGCSGCQGLVLGGGLSRAAKVGPRPWNPPPKRGVAPESVTCFRPARSWTTCCSGSKLDCMAGSLPWQARCSLNSRRVEIAPYGPGRPAEVVSCVDRCRPSCYRLLQVGASCGSSWLHRSPVQRVPLGQHVALVTPELGPSVLEPHLEKEYSHVTNVISTDRLTD